MNKIASVITLFLLVFTSLHAQEPEHPLNTGTYLLVYQVSPEVGMKDLKVSFATNAEGKLTVSCSDAAYTSTSIMQVQSTFQFSLVQPGHRDEQRGTEQPLEALCFVGHPKVVFTEQNTYKQEAGVCIGTVASITAQAQPQNGVSKAGSGTFLLFKLP